MKSKSFHEQIKGSIKDFSEKFGDLAKNEYDKFTAASNGPNNQEAIQAWSEDEQSVISKIPNLF